MTTKFNDTSGLFALGNPIRFVFLVSMGEAVVKGLGHFHVLYFDFGPTGFHQTLEMLQHFMIPS